MIFSKNLRLFRFFSTVKKPFANFNPPTPQSNSIKSVPQDMVSEILSLFSKNQINEISLKSKRLFEQEQKISLSSRFFQLSLFFLKTKDGNFLKDMKSLESKIIPTMTEMQGIFLETNKTKDNAKKLDPSKVEDFLKSLFGMNILENGDKNSDKTIFLLQQLQKASKEASESLMKDEKIKLELLFLIIANDKLMKFKKNSPVQKEKENMMKDLLPFLFDSMELYPIYKKVLLEALEKPRNLGLKELTDSELLLSLLFLITSYEKQEKMDDFYSLLWELSTISKFTPALNLTILTELTKRKVSRGEFSNRFSMFTVTLINSLGQNLNFLPAPEFARVLFLLSKDNNSKYNLSVMQNFWENALEVFPEKYFIAKNFSQKSMLYSFGKNGFLNDKIKQKVYAEELKNMSRNVNSISENKVLLDKYLNVFRSGVNLNVFGLDQCRTFFNNLDVALQHNPEERKKTVIHLAPSAIRMKYLDQNFWKQYFEALESVVSDKNQNLFQIFFVLKVFNFIFSGTFKFICEGDAKEKYPEIYKYYTNSMNNNLIKQVFDKNLLHYYNEEISLDSKTVNNKSSLLEETMSKCLNSLGTPYLTQYAVEFMFVDFYLPLENIIVEVMGPSHFVKTGENNDVMTLLTEFKVNCLRALGYNLILIDHDQEVKRGMSIELSFLKQYQDIVKKK